MSHKDGSSTASVPAITTSLYKSYHTQFTGGHTGSLPSNQRKIVDWSLRGEVVINMSDAAWCRCLVNPDGYPVMADVPGAGVDHHGHHPGPGLRHAQAQCLQMCWWIITKTN